MKNIDRVFAGKKGFVSATLLFAGILIFAFAALSYFSQRGEMGKVNFLGARRENLASPAASVYDPTVNPADFTNNITNKYQTFPVGKKMTYEARTKDGLEKVEILITDQTKQIMDVTTLVYWDRVWLNGQLIEDTRDYLAQNKTTQDVWYFGEDVDNYQNGVFVDHHGSWIAGVDGAKPGIWVKANPQVGETYRQEYYKGNAEDMVTVQATDAKASVPEGRFKNCLKTFDWTPLEPDSQENKYYCPEVGAQVLTEDLTGNEKLQLVDVFPSSK